MTTPVGPNNSPYLTSSAASSQQISTMTLNTPADSASTSKKRCSHAECKKKLTLLDFDCKCGGRFCCAHRMAEDHACTFDYRAASGTHLSGQLVKAAGDRLVDRI